jgi:hypothetical protein
LFLLLLLLHGRLKYGMRRGIDGRVQLRRRDGVWMQCKLDMEIKGTMLLRDTANSHIHILMTDRLEQVCLGTSRGAPAMSGKGTAAPAAKALSVILC